MTKVLITGANGFVGSHLTEALQARDDEVTCLVRKTSHVDRLRAMDANLKFGDVTDRESLAGPMHEADIVYHLAGRTMVLRRQEFFDVNEQGVRNVVEAASKQTTPPVVVVVSSLAAAGPMTHGRPRTETDDMEPVSDYGRSKLAGEMAAREFAEDVPISIVRPPMVLGEADSVGLQLFAPIARRGIHWVSSLGRDRVSVIHATDLAQLLILAAERGKRVTPGIENDPSVEPGLSASRGVYFAASDCDPTYADLGRMVGKALGRSRVTVVPTPPRAVWVIAGANYGPAHLLRKPAFLNFDKAREIRAGSWVCSARAAADELGFSVALPLADRLRQTAEWYRREGWLVDKPAVVC